MKKVRCNSCGRIKMACDNCEICICPACMSEMEEMIEDTVMFGVANLRDGEIYG